MPHPDEPALVVYVADNSSGVALAVYDATDSAVARAALQAAAAEISQIPHPAEPKWSLPNWCEVLDEDGVPVLHLDMKDEIRYAALIVRIVLHALAAAGADGKLEPKRQPEDPFEYDPRAARFADMEPLSELDARGLPSGFPDGFPVPEEATLVQAGHSRDGTGEHAAWRRSTGPFTGYLDRLRAYGCTFGVVPRPLAGDGTVRYTLWRDGAGGSVTLYQSEARSTHSPVYWYVSVVWQPQAEPPAVAVEPDEAPDTRPLPSGPAAVREVAEFLLPPELVAGYEAVAAIAAAGHALEQLVSARPDPADRRPAPTMVAARLAPVLGRLDPGQLKMVRHTCLTMVANLVAAGRRPRSVGLNLVPDEDGHLYAADIRERAPGVVEPKLIPVLETGLALVKGGPMVAEALSGVPGSAVRPLADRYVWLFAGLEPEQLTAARDACWRIFED
ncbi:hypothetical protein OG470_20275 [Micromonospora sp. NBC_00389]|uniref:hypothetical protein n=1 Tax=Micromonospora sp. NBC_00389 TaxID=2903586 RepID=UPI002E1BB9CD